jgi:hypothetical protein
MKGKQDYIPGLAGIIAGIYALPGAYNAYRVFNALEKQIKGIAE